MNLFNLYAQRQMMTKTVAARMVGARSGGLPVAFRPSVKTFRQPNSNSYGVSYNILDTGSQGHVAGFGLVNTGPGSQAALEAEYVASQSTFTTGTVGTKTADMSALVQQMQNPAATPWTAPPVSKMVVQTLEQWVASLETLSRDQLAAVIDNLKRIVANSLAALRSTAIAPAQKVTLQAAYDDEVRRLNAALAVYERDVRADDARRIKEASMREQQSGQVAEGGIPWGWVFAGLAGLAAFGVVYAGKK